MRPEGAALSPHPPATIKAGGDVDGVSVVAVDGDVAVDRDVVADRDVDAPNQPRAAGDAGAAARERAVLWRLFSHADELEPLELTDWLQQLEADRHPQLAALRLLIDTRDRVASSDFLETPAAPVTPIDGGTAPSTEWAEGASIGAYRLVRAIGSGGMAEVWLADRVDGAFKRQVAIKLLFDRPSRAQRENFAERFRRERDILAALHHPNIAGLHDAGVTASGQPWLALDYVRGEPITTWCDAKGLSVRARVQLFIQVLHAVEYAHASLVMHRDLKPANILVTESGKPMLLDFGIAKLIEPGAEAASESELTREGGRPLTLAYASPEQVLGQPLTTACDQYALGVVLYELLAGEAPYELSTGSPAQWQDAVVNVEPRAPSRRALPAAMAAMRGASPKTWQRELVQDLDAITLKALQKNANARYASVEGLRADLSRWLAAEPVMARVPSWHDRALKFTRRHRAGVALASVAVVALTTAVVVASLFAVEARRESARVTVSRDALLDLFRQADPDQSAGGNVTAKDMLAGGRKRIDQAFAGQPDLQASLLASVGELQGNIGDDVASEATLARVVEIYRQRGPSRELALALAAHASELYHAGDYDRAQQVVKEAADFAATKPNDAELQERVLSISGQVAWQRNDLARGGVLMADALQRATKLYGPLDARVLQLMSAMASLETQRGNFVEARRTVETLIARSRVIPSLRLTDLYRLELQRARIDMADGHYELARADLAAAIPTCAAKLGETNEMCLLLNLRQSELLIREGKSAESLALVPVLRKQANSADSPRRQAESLITVCRILALNGQLPADDPLRVALVTLARSGAEVKLGESLKAKASLAEAEALIRERHAGAALTEIGAAHERIHSRQELASDLSLTGRVKSLEGVALLLNGDSAGALLALQAAKAQYQQAFGKNHPLVALIDVNLAQALSAAGQQPAADQLARNAIATLQSFFGADAPVLTQFKARGRLSNVSPTPPRSSDSFALV